MASFAPNLCSSSSPICINNQKIFSLHDPSCKNSIFRNYPTFRCKKSDLYQFLVVFSHQKDSGNAVKEAENPKFKWVKNSSPNLTEEQKQAISQLPAKMTNRCKALMKQIICFSAENGTVSLMLAAWVKSTKPRRADWLAVLKELERLHHSLYFEVVEHALTEESFETNIRDYTKLIHSYAKRNMLPQAEKTLASMKNRGFLCDQVTLTALIHMYSKSGNLEMAEDIFQEMKLLGVPLDRRSYGSILMAYIREGMLARGEALLKEMEAQEIYAAREVYKALLRAYSMNGDWQGAERVFHEIQLAGIVPDVKICGLLINAYVLSGRSREARLAFENMRRAGLEPNDKCVALVLCGYEKENRLNEGLDFLVELERDGIMVERESSDLLAKWFGKIGVVEEVELVLREFASRMEQHVL